MLMSGRGFVRRQPSRSRHSGTLGAMFTVVGCFSTVLAQGLPQWSAEDWEQLKKGELVAGADLLVDNDRAKTTAEDGSEESQLSEPVALVDGLPTDEQALEQSTDEAKLIPESFLDDYFEIKAGSYLVDPQRLFSNQETLDREGFLKYYADESEIDVRIYLFDAHQEIPEPYSLHRLVEEQYADGPMTAVVFYFLGNPGRNQLLFGGEGADLVKAEPLRKMLESASIKAMEKSDPVAQMESFIVQLSISIYWMEQEKIKAREVESQQVGGAGVELDKSQVQQPVDQKQDLWLVVKPYLWLSLAGVAGFLLFAFVLVRGWMMWSRSRKFMFPVLDIPRRLEADYAAGVGAVIGFHNKLDSPSAQKDQIPEYLTQI